MGMEGTKKRQGQSRRLRAYFAPDKPVRFILPGLPLFCGSRTYGLIHRLLERMAFDLCKGMLNLLA